PYYEYTHPNAHLHSFPTRRSSDLDSDAGSWVTRLMVPPMELEPYMDEPGPRTTSMRSMLLAATLFHSDTPPVYASLMGTPSFRIDRKSTRLNSSHVKISYAVFCLK